MRKKILLAGGYSHFEGPWVSLEKGEWLVEPPSQGKVNLLYENGEIIELDGSKIRLNGPVRIKAIIEETSKEVHLDAYKVA